MGRDDFDNGNEVVKARLIFIVLLVIIGLLVFGGIKLLKGGFFDKSRPDEVTKVSVDDSFGGNEENSEDNTEVIIEDILAQEKAENDAVQDTSAESTNDIGIESSKEGNGESTEESTVNDDITKAADPQVEVTEGVKQEISVVKSENENSTWTLGVDVSSHQGTIDWKTVADTGISFAMVRIGYRSIEQGNLVEDVNARYNLQEATAKGLKAGAYFVSTATNEAEAVEEANFVLNIIAKYQITYPVAFDCERFEDAKSRQYGMSVSQRTACAKAFLDTVKAAGYEPMFYASKGSVENNRLWETTSLEQAYKMWISWYSTTPFPDIQSPSYSGKCAMWQYTDNGMIGGFKKPLDINVAYFGYGDSAKAHDEAAPDTVKASVEANMTFTSVNEMVTAKDKTNLRDMPSQGSDSTVVYTLSKGEYVLKTGSSPSGWCRVELNGLTLYAKESYLTSDVNSSQQQTVTEQTPQASSSEIKTVFSACDDYVTPKQEVNLRTLPSITNEASVVVVCVKNGENLHRTGINSDLGWSRVEYNGQILYCVSSYLNTVTQ